MLLLQTDVLELPKIESLKGVPKILLERGGCHFFYYFTVQLHLLCVYGETVKFVLLYFDFSVF